MVETINKMSKMQRKLTLELGYEPSVAELAKALDMSEDKVMEIMQIAREPASLETPMIQTLVISLPMSIQLHRKEM